MSYPCSRADAIAVISEIEESENTHSNSGSSILHGSSSPGGAASGTAPASGVLEQKRTKLHRRTSELTRSYGSTASGK